MSNSSCQSHSSNTQDANTSHDVTLVPNIRRDPVSPHALSGPPTPQDWEAYRPLITRLYDVEGRTLENVSNILKQRFGFNASDRMFKKRFGEWNIHKNYRRTDKVAVLNGLQSPASPKRPAVGSKTRSIPVHRLVRFCRENGLKDDERILDALRAHQSARETQEGTELEILHKERRLRYNSVWPLGPQSPLRSNGEAQDGEIILLQIGHYLDSYSDSQLCQFLCDSTVDVDVRIFHRSVPCNPKSIWNLVDYGQYLLHVGDIHNGFSVLHFACSTVRHLLCEHGPLTIPYLVSIFANELSYWSSRDSQSQLYEFFLNMAASILGDCHPVTKTIRMLRNIHRSDLFMLAWQRSLDIFSDKLGIRHPATTTVAEDFSSALYRPSYPGHARPRGKYPNGMREYWSREAVFLALDRHFRGLQEMLTLLSEENDEELGWLRLEVFESLRLLQHILASNERIMDPQQQWLRHDIKLRFLLLCNQSWNLMDFPTAGDARRAKQAISSDDSPETVLARQQRTQTLFSGLQRTWTELDEEQEAARLKAGFPMAFEHHCS